MPINNPDKEREQRNNFYNDLDQETIGSSRFSCAVVFGILLIILCLIFILFLFFYLNK